MALDTDHLRADVDALNRIVRNLLVLLEQNGTLLSDEILEVTGTRGLSASIPIDELVAVHRFEDRLAADRH